MSATARPSRVEIDLGALRHNISEIKSRLKPSAKLMAVVKADAYGHGAPEISRTADMMGVDYLGVAFLEEADELRQAGVVAPISILYPESPERSVEAARRGYYLSFSSIDDVLRVKQAVAPEKIPLRHFLTINSGMNRYGMDTSLENLDRIAEKGLPGDGLIGFNTNLADPLKGKKTLSDKQVDKFFKFVAEASRSSKNGLLFSHEASGSVWEKGVAHGSLVRVGLLMYGIAPDKSERMKLRPVMAVTSKIAEIHRLPKGDGVGYGFSFIAKRDTDAAVVPVGYADGYPWSLSNKGSVIIRDKLAPVIGRVCMDAFMIDVTDIAGAESGDEVVLLGSRGDYSIDANMLGQWAGSFAYEIVSGWGKRMPRVYI